jgi:hypothetical protein
MKGFSDGDTPKSALISGGMGEAEADEGNACIKW